MVQFISLSEAADFLEVSKGTLRNWDRSGKLIAKRNPANGYRQYDMDDLLALKASMTFSEGNTEQPSGHIAKRDSKEIKAIVSKLHNVLRDSDASSDIMERFDEISKLLFLALLDTNSCCTDCAACLDKDEYANSIRLRYKEMIEAYDIDTQGLFDSINLSSQAIVKCMEILSDAEINEMQADIKGLAYEEVIKGTFDKSDNQQFFTPETIVTFMVDMFASRLCGTVCDPACGTGSFLIEAARRQGEARYLGLEVDPRLAWVSEMNMCLHGIGESNIQYLENAGSLGECATSLFGTVDVILTNPPFGSDYSDSEVLSRFELGRGRKSRRRGILFLEQSCNILKDGGVVAIIIDQGVLNSSSTVDVREYLLSKFDFLAIVDLPDTAFMPYATVSTSILFMRKKDAKSARGRKVFYAKAANVGRKANGDPDYIYSNDGTSRLNSDLPEIVSAWKSYEATGELPFADHWYVCDFDNEPFENPSLRLDYAFHHPMRMESVKNINSCSYPMMSLAELCVERNESYLPSSNPDVSMILMTGLANIESFTGRFTQVPTAAASVKSAVKKYEPGDIVFAKMRPLLRKIAYMSSENPGFVSSECAVFTVRKDAEGNYAIKPELLAAILRSDFVFGQIVHLVSGSGRPRISNKDLRKILIPVLPAEAQATLMAEIVANTELAIRLRNKAEAMLEEASQIERDNMSSLVSRAFKGGR